jgi:hypothetical protein
MTTTSSESALVIAWMRAAKPEFKNRHDALVFGVVCHTHTLTYTRIIYFFFLIFGFGRKQPRAFVKIRYNNLGTVVLHGAMETNGFRLIGLNESEMKATTESFFPLCCR